MAKHSGRLSDLKALMAYRNRPEGAPTSAKTNWSTIPENDNVPLDDMHIERRIQITPSIDRIVKQVAEGKVKRNDDDQIIAIGDLRFSDGTQTERAYTYGLDGKLLQYDARMPTGAMLGTSERQSRVLGGNESQQDALFSNRYFAEMLNTLPHRHITAPRKNMRKGQNYSAEESRKMLAEAYANTPILPLVKRYSTGLPCGSRNAAESFIGMQKRTTGQGGAIVWEDLATAHIQREIWGEALANIRAEYRQALDGVDKAKTLGDIAPGGHKRTAERRGKRILQAANDNLALQLKNAS